MKISTLFAATLLLLTPYTAQSEVTQTCFQTANTQSQLNQCSRQAYQEADDELNLVYKKIRKLYKDDPVFLDKLKKAQLAWIKLRDADLELKYPHTDKQGHYGTAYSMCSPMYMTKLTMERVEYLKTWLAGGEEGDVCNGSPMYPSQMGAGSTD